MVGVTEAQTVWLEEVRLLTLDDSVEVNTEEALEEKVPESEPVKLLAEE
jgi:hypothetical protein